MRATIIGSWESRRTGACQSEKGQFVWRFFVDSDLRPVGTELRYAHLTIDKVVLKPCPVADCRDIGSPRFGFPCHHSV